MDKTYQNVVLVYTNFVSLLAQTPAALPLLPLTISSEKRTDAQRAMIYEGGSEAVFNAIVPEYLGGVLYGALCESTASEQAARRMAMDAASKNADEIIVMDKGCIVQRGTYRELERAPGLFRDMALGIRK